jgi:hypothetical protein
MLDDQTNSFNGDNNLDNQSWAQQEFANANLGDKRRTLRLTRLAEQRCSHPQASFSQACGNNAETKAAYRFYENNSISNIAYPILQYYLVTNKLLRHA